MTGIIALLVLVAVAVIWLQRLKASKPSSASGASAPFLPRVVMNPAEIQLYKRLRLAAPSLSIFPQVALSQLLDCKDFGKRSTVKQKVADFVVCNRLAKPLMVIELDGWRHATQSQQARDSKKDAALSEAGIQVVRFRHKRQPADAELLALLGGLSPD